MQKYEESFTVVKKIGKLMYINYTYRQTLKCINYFIFVTQSPFMLIMMIREGANHNRIQSISKHQQYSEQ